MKSSSFDRCEHRVAAAFARSSALDGQSDCPAHANMPRSLAWSPRARKACASTPIAAAAAARPRLLSVPRRRRVRAPGEGEGQGEVRVRVRVR